MYEYIAPNLPVANSIPFVPVSTIPWAPDRSVVDPNVIEASKPPGTLSVAHILIRLNQVAHRKRPRGATFVRGL